MELSHKNNPAIGIFDSGVGGLTVLQEVRRVLPKENIVYFADTARFPYGEKSPDAIIRYSLENAQFLLKQNIKLLVVACNTASAYAVDSLRKSLSIPLVEVVTAGVERALQVTRNKRIAVVGTRGTIHSGIYQKKIGEHLPEASVEAISCPLLAPLVEEKFLDHPATKIIIREYLAPLKEKRIDTLLLGCTHYPLLKRLFQEEVGTEVTIVDSASTCAEAVAATLCKFNGVQTSSSEPSCRFFVSDDPQKFKMLSKEFLGMPVESVSIAPRGNH